MTTFVGFPIVAPPREPIPTTREASLPQIRAIADAERAPAVRALPGVADARFDETLARSTRDAAITAAARALTAQALVAPILKELRANSNAWGPFAAGDAEKSFGPMLDLAIADRIAASPRLGVATILEERLRAREAPARSAPGAASARADAAIATTSPMTRVAGRGAEGWIA